uniref:ABC-type xenobiotic transporter n=1 Tax=Chenopodium quinoa TaxID=63459 RepID=A0A803M010_CHEQI
MGQRQLFCLGRALLRRSRVLVLDEATASIDNATDTILQKTIRTEFASSTVITVAHRIPTVMDCTKVLAISDGNLVEYDEPMKLMKQEGSLFGQLVKEYWSHIHSAVSNLKQLPPAAAVCAESLERVITICFFIQSSVYVYYPSFCLWQPCFHYLLQSTASDNPLIKLHFYQNSSKKIEIRANHRQFSTLHMLSAVFNASLGLVYIGLGIRILKEKLRSDHSISPIHWWVIYFFHGVTWLVMGLTTKLIGGGSSPKAPLQILSILVFVYAGIYCCLVLYFTIMNHERITVKAGLDILSFLGAGLLLLCTYRRYKNEGMASDGNNTLYIPLNVEEKGLRETDLASQITPFSTAGLLSVMSFCWLKPLLKLGKEKTLQEDDVPKLRDIDRAGSCYLQFLDQVSKRKQENELPSESTILWSIVACHWREILMSGFFAFFKIVALSAGPLLLNSFIKVAEGKEAFKYEGYLLAILLFLSKILESLSQRQWGMHSGGEIMNYVSVDAYRIGEFPYWFHRTWTTGLQLCFALLIMIHSIGLATVGSLVVIILTVLCNTPIGKLQHKFQSKLMVSQDERLKACSEALVNMKVLKLYAWETHFKNVVEALRKVECKRLSAVQLQKGYSLFFYWSSPVLISAATFGACYILKVPLHASNVFTFLATLRLGQEPIKTIPDVIGVVIQARVAFARIVKFLAAPELQIENIRKERKMNSTSHVIQMKSANLSWEISSSKPTLRNINLDVHPGEKVAICGEVGSGKSTLLTAILGELPHADGTVVVYGKIAYVSQTAWIQTGTIHENILFGSAMDDSRYQETLQRCSLVKDLELLPYADNTEIGERGVNLSGGQKQQIQLARALYLDADIYLLDDPFSAVDAHTAASLFNDYVMEALSEKTVLLVTHQVDFLPAFHCCLLTSDREILQAGTYDELLASSEEFLGLVTAHKETAGTKTLAGDGRHNYPAKEVMTSMDIEKQYQPLKRNQLIKKEERDVGDTGSKPYLIYLNQNKGYLYFSILALANLAFLISQILQNTWMAYGIDNPHVRKPTLIVVYLIIGLCSTFCILFRSLAAVTLGMETSKSLFSQLLNSLFRAPMSFYDSTPLGRILSRISSDLSIVDLDIPFIFMTTFGATAVAYTNLVVLTIVTWQVFLISIPVIYMAIRLQRYYYATAKELMRLNGTTKSMVANHLAESVAGGMTIRAFQEEDRFFAKTLDLIDANASPLFHNFAANEWLIQRIEILSAIVLAAAALCMVLLPTGTFSSGFIGMALTYGLALNISMVNSIQNQCTLANYIISVERINQYMDIPSEPPEIIKDNRPPQNWPSVGKVEIYNLQIRYRPDTPLVLKGTSCTFEGGDRIGIVGRTGSGKSTLIGALFRLMEPVEGKIIVDGIDIGSIGLHDLRSCFGIIPQEPTLFNGTVRFNIDPLCQSNDEEIWQVLEKCQLKEDVLDKEHGLDSSVLEDGSNWSMGQRQLFCLGRALLRRSKVLVFDEATASIDNATDMIMQKTIRRELTDCTMITVAHRIPTVMDCTKVLAISDGNLVEYDEPLNLMNKEGSLFGQLVKEYWSHSKCNRQSPQN